MILTEDKIYTMSLETESVNRDSGLTNNTIELEFTTKSYYMQLLPVECRSRD